MITGWNDNTVLTFEKQNENEEDNTFDLAITYSCRIDGDSRVEIHITSITNKILLDIKNEMDRLIIG